MNFYNNTIKMIISLYSNVLCRSFINDIKINSFSVTFGIPKCCPLSGTLFNETMIPFLAKLDYFSIARELSIVKPNIVFGNKLIEGNTLNRFDFVKLVVEIFVMKNSLLQ